MAYVTNAELGRYARGGWRRALLWVAAALLGCLPWRQATAENAEVVVGVLTIRSPEQTLATWLPTADYLTGAMPGVRFRFEALDAGQLNEAVAQGRLDFVLTNPSHYVYLEREYRLTRLATLVRGWAGHTLKSFGGVVVTHAERTDIRKLADLRGRNIAAVGPEWLGAYQAQVGLAMAEGIDLRNDARIRFTGEPQDRALIDVVEGRADAAFVRSGLIEEMYQEGKLDLGKIRVLAPRQVEGFPLRLSTPLYPEWPLAALPRTSQDLASQMAIMLLQMPSGSFAARLGGYAGWSIPADYQSVHELMRQLRLPPYDVRPEFSFADVLRQYELGLFLVLAAGMVGALLLAARFRRLHGLVSRRSGELEAEVVARRTAEEGLRLAASVFEHSNDGIMITDRNNAIVDVNAAFSAITGWTRNEVLGRNPRLLQSGHQDAEFYREMWTAINENGHWRGEIWNRRKNGEQYVELLDVTAVRDLHGEVAHYVGMFSDVTQLRSSQERLRQMAHFDPLTHLPNRALLADRLNQAVAMAQREEALLAVCFVDLDGFKPINDEFGHEIGDQLLIATARRMEATLRAVDTVARLGGDEFVLLVTGVSDMQEIDTTLRRAMAAIEQPVIVDHHELRVSASIGLTVYPLDEADPESLLRHADQAMYEAKRAGRSRYCLFDASQDKEAQSRVHRTERIGFALKTGEFVLHYQPKVDMRAGRVVGVEALLRWQHPLRGLVYPGEFLPLIEQTELIAEIDDWVIGEALRQIEAWMDEDFAMPVSVNLSARQIQSPGFALRVQERLARHAKVSPHLLEFEILESAALGDIEGVRHIIRHCQDFGALFSLDDFGTGYSSLSYLKRLPVDTIKIDQSFVRDLLDNPEDLAIVEGIVGLSKVFQRRVVGEGVESPEHGVMLMRLGCDVAQGYGIGRPMPPEELPQWCREFRPDPQWAEWADVPWNLADFPLLIARNDHVKWVRTIARVVEGATVHFTEGELLDHHQCRFGRWYYGSGRERYGDLEEFAAIEPVHAEVHCVGADIVRLVGEDDGETAQLRLDYLLALRDRVLANLSALQRMVVGKD